VLLPIGVGDAPLLLPDLRPGPVEDLRTGIGRADVAFPLRAVDDVAHVGGGPGDLPAHERYDPFIGILVLHAEAVPQLAVVGPIEAAA